MQAACQWRPHLSGRAAFPRLARQMVSCAVTDIAGCDLESGHLVEERRRVAYTPSIHADSASGRNRLRPAKHFTRTFSQPPAHNTRTHTHRQTYAGACRRARDARARGARERFARTGGHHVAEFLAGHRRHRSRSDHDVPRTRCFRAASEGELEPPNSPGRNVAHGIRFLRGQAPGGSPLNAACEKSFSKNPRIHF